ncbi:MAG: hypothetical protein AAF415_07320 [Pseudomonadota bacterium]
MLRTLVNAGATALSIGCIGIFFLFSPTPPILSAIDQPGKPVTIDSSSSSVTAFYEKDRDALRLTVIFQDPMKQDETLLRTSIRLADQQSFSLVLGNDEAQEGGDKFTFSRTGANVQIRAEQYPGYDSLREMTADPTGTIAVAGGRDIAS